jgi:predicted lipoprotein with Yx(FWY)xxD motif
MRRRMRRTVRGTLMVLGATAGLVLVGCGAADEGATGGANTGDGTVVATAQGALGTFLTDVEGRTLYLFTEDSPGVSTCADACLTAWPALLSEGAPIAGMDADAALLGAITRDDGGVQVTYAGWPLYRYAGDAAPGDTTGQGVGGVWFAVSPSGEAIAPAADLDEDTSMGGYGSGGSSGAGGAYGERDSGDYGY